MRKQLPFRPTDKTKSMLETIKSETGISYSESINRAVQLYFSKQVFYAHKTQTTATKPRGVING